LKKYCAAILLVGCSSGFSSAITNHFLEIPADSGKKAPWFTGPLLAPSAHTIPPGHVNFEPYLFFFSKTGVYDKHKNIQPMPHVYTLLSQNPVQIGITPWMDCQITPQLFYKFTQGVRSTQPGDLPVAVDFQLFNIQERTLQPALKLTFRASLPFGKFENLSPEKRGTDGVGTGSFLPTVALTFSRLIPLGMHYLETRLNLNYTIPNSVHVKGLNVYGGAPDTDGTVYPGNIFNADFGMEFSLTQNWVLAMDVNYIYANKTKFFGNPGTMGIMKAPSSEQLSLAPAIEYNWSINVGIIAGAWFTVAGRNASRFASSVVALNLYL
jgi:hypothetical protein